MSDQSYWDDAATDPDVDNKYIANIELGPCIEALEPALNGGTILEIGSGVGRLTIPNAKRLKKTTITGVDISPAMIDIAIRRSMKANVVECCSFISPEVMENLPDETFDSAYTMLTFQHIGGRVVQMYIQEVARLLKPRGVFRFQFVEGDHHSPQDHNHRTEEIVDMLHGAGFAVKTVDEGIIFPQWTWITAVKGAPDD
jgi:ubiquinone/menaquinone biosynthesis C-methylase UbiE